MVRNLYVNLPVSDLPRTQAFFSALGFGARWLAPLFARPRAWQVLDALIGLTMWVLSALLLRHVLQSH